MSDSKWIWDKEAKDAKFIYLTKSDSTAQIRLPAPFTDEYQDPEQEPQRQYAWLHLDDNREDISKGFTKSGIRLFRYLMTLAMKSPILMHYINCCL